MKVAGITDVGLHRTRNEDAFLIDEVGQFYLVCDGMGGHKGGNVASQLAIRTMRDKFRYTDENDIVAAMQVAVAQTNEVIYQRGCADESLHEMGTTLTAALVHQNILYVAHVGDSSLFWYHDNQLTKITRDHTLAEQLVAEGVINSGDVQVNAYNHILTRAVGVESSVEIDIYQTQIKTGDWILICTDGLTDLVSESELSETFAQGRDPQLMAEEMVAMALDKGGYDNITIVLLCV